MDVGNDSGVKVGCCNPSEFLLFMQPRNKKSNVCTSELMKLHLTCLLCIFMLNHPVLAKKDTQRPCDVPPQASANIHQGQMTFV